VRTVVITAGETRLKAELNITATAGAIWNALPITAAVNIWGSEIYFAIPVQTELEKGQETVVRGDLAYWPPGHALCIFFGPTPVSRGNEIRPANAVTVLGHITGDAAVLEAVSAGTEISIIRANPD
jgi:uncharacterized protein